MGSKFDGSAGEEGPAMIDASFSSQRHQEDRAAARARRRLIIPLVAALVLIGGVTAWALGGNKVDAPPPNVVTAPANSGHASDELLETAKGLQVTQQAVDQLQVAQDQLAAQKAETKKLSEQIAAVTEKLGRPPAVSCHYSGATRCSVPSGAEVAPPIRMQQAQVFVCRTSTSLLDQTLEPRGEGRQFLSRFRH
jgi:hypothetical protein